MSDWKNVQYKDGKMRTSDGGGGGGSSTFADLDDVSFSDIQNGQVPKYNSDTGKWENANESGGGGTVTDVTVDGVSVVNQQGVAEIKMPTPPSVPDKLSDLSDVQFSNLTDHQPLRYNATSQKWENGADSFPPLIYSDEEREIGVWRDGKPLYQKTLYLEYSFTEDYNISNPILNIDNVVNTKGFIHIGPDGSEEYANPWFTSPYIVSTSNFASISASKSTIRMISKGWGSTKARVTLQYTKTTDTAGSGTWTTQGGYAHHYSTTEKVVGIYNGKPLYEKSYFGLTAPSNGDSTNIINVASLNIQKMPFVYGSIKVANNTTHSGGESFRLWQRHNSSQGYAVAIIVSNSSYYGGELDVTIQYTKTTD